MSLATGIRASVRNLITDLGSAATLYPFSSATKSYNDEGDVTISAWSGGSSIKIVSANNYKLRRIMGVQGEENNQGDRIVFIRDDITLSAKDKLTIDSENYEIDEIKKIDPIQNTLLAYRVILSKNVNY